jgi:hypothetical protein
VYATAASRISIGRSRIRNNTLPVKLEDGAGARLFLADSELFNNFFGVEVQSGNFGRLSGLEISRGGTGIFCEGTCDISDVRIWDKTYGISNYGLARLNHVEVTGCSSTGLVGDGVFESYGNNVIRGNVSNFGSGAALTTVALQ